MTHRAGITLPELLVSITILGLIGVVIGNLFIGSARFQRDEGLRIEVGENAVRLLSVVDETLRQGKDILPTGTISGTNYTTNENTLVFALPSQLSGGTLSPTDLDLGVIYLDTSLATNHRLWLKIEPHANSVRPAVNRAVVDNVKDLYFRYTTPVWADSNALTVTLTTTQTINNQPFTRASILYAALRNRP